MTIERRLRDAAIVRGFGVALLVAAAAARAMAAARSPQLLLVQAARVVPHATRAGRTKVRLRALVNDSVGDRSLTNSLLDNTVVVTVADASGLLATVPLTGCTAAKAASVVCKDAASRTSAVATPLDSGPFAYQLVVSSHGAVGAARAPQVPLIVALDAPLASQRIDVISDCRQPHSDRGLICKDRQRPNIILIMTDDQRPDTVQYMPRLISLIANQGVTFANSFVTTPTCCPSRASTLNGQYAHRHGVRGGSPPLGGAPMYVGPDQSTVATWLHGQGYRTGMYGKYLLSYYLQCPPFTATPYIPPGWDEWHVFLNQGYFDYKLVENGVINSFGTDAADYSTDVLFAKAVEFILSARGQPFFLHLATSAPHADGALWPVPAPRHNGMFASTPVPMPPNYDEEDVSDKPPWVQALPRADDLIPGTFFTYGLWSGVTFERQLESLQAVDEGLGLIESALQATGQADNTVIIFTSDNGLCWEEHRWYGKACPYEECLRVPLLIRFPRQITAARQETGIALNIDLAPTIAALARATPTSPVDGESLVPLLQGSAGGWRTDFLIEYWAETEDGINTYAGVHSQEWKYDELASATQETELYDLTTDPYELENLSADPTYTDLVTTLRARLAALLAVR